MTWLLCLASFTAGYLVQWTASRRKVAQAERNALAIIHARHSAEADLADAIRIGEGAGR